MRSWFIFWHANVHSMLTEVAFCLSCYFRRALTIEYIPLVLENRQIDKVPFFHNLSPQHALENMAVFAATGAFLSFFHQGSLGGVAGVLYTDGPSLFANTLLIWPFTFFLFTWSAAAFGPSFTLCHHLVDGRRLPAKKLVKDNVVFLLGQDFRLDDFYLYHR